AKLLPSPKKIGRREHHAALAYAEVPDFMRRLRQHDEIEARALEFLILTAGRAGEVVGASWDEIERADDGWTWTGPAGRMEARKPQRIALARSARAVLERTPPTQCQGPIFPNVSGHMLWLFLRTLTDKTTVHGFRSSFRDWAAEQTNFPREVAELALAHRVGDAVERAYQRGDLLRKRRALGEAWAKYCTSAPAATGKVTPIRA